MSEAVIELSPGRQSGERGPLGIEQMLSALHPLYLSPLRLEIYASSRIVRFRVHVPSAAADWVESFLYAQYPDATCTYVEENPDADTSLSIAACYLRMRRPGVFPIKRHPQLVDPTTRLAADPLDLLLHALGHLPEKHEAAIVFELRSVGDQYRKRATNAMLALASREISRAERATDWFVQLEQLPSPIRWLRAPVALGVRHLIPQPAETPTRALAPESSSTHERESDVQGCLAKVRRHLFSSTVHIAVRGRSASLGSLLEMITAAFAQFDLPGLNGLVPSRSARRCIFSTEELATIWHLPAMPEVQSHLGTAYTVALPPPASLPDLTRDHVVLGHTTYRRQRRAVGLAVIDRRRHLYVIGKTGVGKTTLLEHLILADIQSGRGVGLIDPHGDLATSMIARVPAKRTNDVILVDPSDIEHPISFNPLDVQRERAILAADAMLSTFVKLFATGDFASWGPRLEDILRNSLLALTEAGGTTLLDLLRIIGDNDSYRKQLLGRVRDPVIRQWWREEFPKLKANRREDPFASVTNKLRQLLTTPTIRNMLAQRRGKLDLRRAMDEGKIVICNLSKGKLGERTSTFLGALLVTRFQLDAMSRAEIPESRRRDFFLYVDEFQNFASPSFAEVLSEARKYRLSLTLANQYLGQMTDELKRAILGNVGTIFSMQVGVDDATLLAEQLGSPLDPNDLAALPRHQGFVRMEIDGRATPPFSLETLPPDPAPSDRRRAEIIVRQSRARYSTPRRTVEQSVARAM